MDVLFAQVQLLNHIHMYIVFAAIQNGVFFLSTLANGSNSQKILVHRDHYITGIMGSVLRNESKI